MLTRILDLPEGVIALDAVGTITRRDYVQVIEPILDEARREGRPLRLLIRLGREYEGFTAGAVFEKAVNAVRRPALPGLVEGYALVSDIPWIREMIHLAGFVVPFPMRAFDEAELGAAVAWLTSLPAREEPARR